MDNQEQKEDRGKDTPLRRCVMGIDGLFFSFLNWLAKEVDENGKRKKRKKC